MDILKTANAQYLEILTEAISALKYKAEKQLLRIERDKQLFTNEDLK